MIAKIIGSGINTESSIGFRSANVGDGGVGDWVLGTNLNGTNSGNFSLYDSAGGTVLTVVNNGRISP